MKHPRTFVGLSAAAFALAATVATVHFVAQAKDNALAIRVDSQPVNRTPSSGNSYAPIVKKIAPSVVNIYSSRTIKQQFLRTPQFNDPFFRQFEKSKRVNWLGSGIIVTADGYILTASHVVEGADEIKVGISTNKTEYSAKIIGTDPATDIAVLKIDAQDLPALTLGDSSQLEVGDAVLAIGNPFGLGQTVTRGIVSALGRSLPMQDDENPRHTTHYQDFIQTDAAINQGNSGGALVDAEGRLIGINDALISPSGTSAGLGFAIPINMARGVMEDFINGGHVVRGYLGVKPQDLDAGLAKSFGVPNTSGALVTYVEPGSPAEKAGLESGDVIITINDKEISGADNFRATVAQLRPGSKADVTIVRNHAQKKLAVTLGELAGHDVPTATKPNHLADVPTRADVLDGVRVHDLDSNFRYQLRVPLDIVGAVATDVDDESNSGVAGLRPGDVITEINRQPVADAEDAVRLGQAARGEQILIKVWRPGGPRFLSVDNTRRLK